jgi:hypothetical protein
VCSVFEIVEITSRGDLVVLANEPPRLYVLTINATVLASCVATERPRALVRDRDACACVICVRAQVCDAAGLHVVTGGTECIVVRDSMSLQQVGGVRACVPCLTAQAQLFTLPVPSGVVSLALSCDEQALLAGTSARARDRNQFRFTL